MSEPDSSLKCDPVTCKQIALFHVMLGTAGAWTRPAEHCVACHCNWQPGPKLQLGLLGLFHSSVPPPLFHLPHQRTPLSASPPCSRQKRQNPELRIRDFLCEMFEWKLMPFPSLHPPFNQAISDPHTHVKQICCKEFSAVQEQHPFSGKDSL